MRVIIPAAGKGSRLGRETKDNTKCMVDFIDGKIIDHTINILEDLNLHKITIVTGYKSSSLRDYLKHKKHIEYIENKEFETTNNIVSIYLALQEIKNEDVMIIESDLVFEKEVINRALNAKGDCVILVDKYDQTMDGGAVKIENKNIYFYKPTMDDIKNGALKTVNIYKMSNMFIKNLYLPLLKIYIENNYLNEYYEDALSHVSNLPERKLTLEDISGLKWHEIDNKNDLDIAKVKFAKNQHETLINRWGGYWRFKNFNEFNLLVNPFYPPIKFEEEIKSNLNTLIHSYPSSYKVQNDLMAAVLNIDSKFVRVGNGASENILNIVRNLKKSIILGPTFKEYENRMNGNSILVKDLDDPVLKNSEYDSVIIVNPNNPDGRLVEKKEILKILENCNKKIIVDESFMDFCEDKNNQSFMNDHDIENYKNLVVIKSIGKSHGIGGLRLGAIITSNDEVLNLHDNLPIWNINSFAEFYLQSFDKYKKDYELSLDLLKKERKNMFNKLNKIDRLKVIESHTNFIFFSIKGNVYLEYIDYMLKNKILIKKVDNHGLEGIRVAVKSKNENETFCNLTSKFFSK